MKSATAGNCARSADLPCFVWKGFPTFRSHLRMRPVSRRHSRRARALDVQRAAVEVVLVAEALQRQVGAYAVERAHVDLLLDAENAEPHRRFGLELPAAGRAWRRAQLQPREAHLAALEHDAGPDLAPGPVGERARRGGGWNAGILEVRAGAGAAAQEGERQRREDPPHFQPPTAFFAGSFSGRISSPVVETLTANCAPSAIGT